MKIDEEHLFRGTARGVLFIRSVFLCRAPVSVDGNKSSVAEISYPLMENKQTASTKWWE